MDSREVEIGFLIDSLVDPFDFFPFQHTISAIAETMASDVESFGEGLASGPGYGRKYWTVPTEQAYDRIGMSIGLAFVLGQAVLTQLVSTVLRINRLSGGALAYPDRSAVLKLEAKDAVNGFSEVMIVDVAANYFKHHREWPSDWPTSQEGGPGSSTRRACKTLDMTDKSQTSNLYQALAAIGPPGRHNESVERLTVVVGSWRVRLAQRICIDLGIPPERRPDCDMGYEEWPPQPTTDSSEGPAEKW